MLSPEKFIASESREVHCQRYIAVFVKSLELIAGTVVRLTDCVGGIISGIAEVQRHFIINDPRQVELLAPCVALGGEVLP